ncbi:MAG: hypothetical protein ACOC56_06190 [Atribacterota bacterium]
MHYNNVVVALTDDNKKPIREHDSKRLGSSPSKRQLGEISGRSARVIVPFNTEFKILIKNNNDCRIKLEITVDGANISGNGLILDAHSSDYVERSVDVAQKMKFVPSDHEDVADPSNPENGNIEITVYKEKNNCFWEKMEKYEIHIPSPSNPNPYIPTYPYIPSKPWGPNPVWCSQENTLNITRSFADCKQLNSVIDGQAGAVVDGSDSDQTFTKTTWNGNDGDPIKFIFYVKGSDAESAEEQQKELELLDYLNKKYNSK